MTSNIYNTQINNYRNADDGYHYITTDSPRLLDLGIAAFTTGTLFDWLHVRNDGGVRRLDYTRVDELGNDEQHFMKEYRNQKFWRHKYSDISLNNWPHEALFTLSNQTAEQFCDPDGGTRDEDFVQEKFCFYHGWRTRGRSGEYVKVESEGMGGKDMNWTYSAAEGDFTWNNLDAEFFDNYNITGWSSAANQPIRKYVTSPLTQDGTSLIHRVIEMNNYVRLLNQNVDRANWTDTDLALNYFINDIKSSKEKYLQWLALPEFLLDIPKNILKQDGIVDGCTGCSKKEDVYFKLYLYDIYKPKNTARKTTTSSLTVVSTPLTSYGWPYKDKDEKGRTPPSVNPDPSNAVAGEVDLSYNETTGKWEGGTTQVFAIITEDLEAAEQPDLESFLADDELTLLSYESGMKVGKGKAVILAMQNGNPLQWMPDFHYTKNCREKNAVNRKVIVDVINPTNRSFAKGDNVVLQKIHGVWIPQSVGTASDFITPADPKWDFTYLMTNSMFFFRNHDWFLNLSTFDELNMSEDNKSDSKITPNQYEQSFYRWYYSVAETAPFDGAVEPIKTTENSDRYPDSVNRYARVLNGYMQVTSWDFMGIGIGGLRRKGNFPAGANSQSDADLSETFSLAEEYDGDDGINGNALSCTQFSFNQKNDDFEGGGLNGEKNSYPFFGCVFPDGYSASEKYAELMNEDKDFFLAPKNYKSFGNYQSQTPFFYAAKEPFKNLNNVRNNAVATNKHQEFGIFPEGEAGSLKHLPADIGTNASPLGINGQPISNIGIIGELNNQVETPYFRDVVAQYFSKDDFGLEKCLSWVHKKQVGLEDQIITNDSVYYYEDSAFDLKPVNPLKIEFRPLIQEVYSSFEGFDFDGTFYRSAFDFNSLNRGSFAKEGYAFNQSFFNPEYDALTPSLSPFSLFRNPQISETPKIAGKSISADRFEKFKLFALDSDIYGNPGVGFNKGGLRYNAGLSKYEWGFLTSDDMNNAPRFWWNEDWMDTQVPGGGVGVIGAVVTIATRDQVQFNTENAIGLDDAVDSTQLAYPPSFRGGDFSTMNTTQLYARVYQNWPRDQMIYDPRFFVVHHFNPDSNIAKKPIVQEENLNAARIYGNGKVDASESDVDFTVPTYWDNTQIPADGKRVYADSIQESLDTVAGSLPGPKVGVTKLRNKIHWRVNTQRRGKLLPYSYKFATIGMPEIKYVPAGGNAGGVISNTSDQVLDISTDFGFLNGDYVGVISSRIVDADQDILIVNRGQGYTSNSKFVVEGGSGGGVLLKAIVDGNGGVIGFETESTGFGFAPEDFPRTTASVSYTTETNGFGTPFPDFSMFKIKIVAHPDSESGEGFVGYMCRGSMVTTVLEDAKPMEALNTTGPIKLTPDPPLQREGDTTQHLQETDAVNKSLSINPTASTSTLSEGMQSKRNHYDVFLHFHNDISHTRMHSNFRPAELEQMVRLEILTNGSDGGSLASNAQGQNQNSSSSNGNNAANGFAAGGGFGNFNFNGGGFFGGLNGNLGGGTMFR